jgi:hypothetical protein
MRLNGGISGLSLISYWIGNTTFDTVIFILTVYKTLSLYRAGHRLPLVTLLLRDGALYFGVIFCANTMTILTFAFAPPTLKVVHATFAHVVTVILVSHLILNLKQKGAAERKRIVVYEGGKIKLEDSTMGSVSYRNGTGGKYRENAGISEFAVNRTIPDGGTLAKRLSNLMGPLISNSGSSVSEQRKAADMEMGLVKQWTKLGLPPSRPATAMGFDSTIGLEGVQMTQEVLIIGRPEEA